MTGSTANLAGVLGLSLAMTPVASQAGQWEMVSAESRLEFVARYEGQAAPGVFQQFDTQLTFDPAEPNQGHLRVVVDTTSADMNSAEVNQAIRGAQWLAVGRYASAEFDSEAIEPLGDGRYVARGTLRLKGIEKPLEVPFRWQRDGQEAMLSGELTVKRTRFDIGTGEWAADEPIGHAIKVRFDVTLRAQP